MGMSLLAETQASSGLVDQAIATLDRAMDKADALNEHWWHAELYRLKADYLQLISLSNSDEAISVYEKALEICAQQGALTLRLRAATHLSHLYVDQDQPQKAIDLLRPILGTMEEGHDTKDLINAKSLIDAISAKQ